MVSSDCSGDSYNKPNSWLRIRTNVRRNIHRNVRACVRPACTLRQDFREQLCHRHHGSAGVPFHSWFRRLRGSKKSHLPRMGSSPSQSAVPGLSHNAHCRADFHRFTRLFRSTVRPRVQQDEWSLRRNSSNFSISSYVQSSFPWLYLLLERRTLTGHWLTPGLDSTARVPLQSQ